MIATPSIGTIVRALAEAYFGLVAGFAAGFVLRVRARMAEGVPSAWRRR